MACLEHECTRCTWASFSNGPSPTVCPKCGGDVVTTFDEEPDHAVSSDEDEE